MEADKKSTITVGGETVFTSELANSKADRRLRDQMGKAIRPSGNRDQTGS